MIDLAWEDARTVELLLSSPDPSSMANTICFHCQQCAEKQLKAALHVMGEPAPRTHDVHALLGFAARSIPDAPHEPWYLGEDAAFLTGLEASVRYEGLGASDLHVYKHAVASVNEIADWLEAGGMECVRIDAPYTRMDTDFEEEPILPGRQSRQVDEKSL